MTPETLDAIAGAISEAEGAHFSAPSASPISGGDINSSYLLAEGTHQYFVKTNHPQHLPMLESEKTSLKVLAAVGAVAVPKPVAIGATSDAAYLVLNYHPMRTRGDDRELARALVAIHKQRSPGDRYGWEENNFIGTSPQSNRWHARWTEFWQQERLQPQLAAAFQNGYRAPLEDLAEQLQERLPYILADHQPQPSLLHGDLWGGNAAFLQSGEPIIYDPASYYGDRETDLALSELFGGYSGEFYDEYQKLWPLDEGYGIRKNLYNLYHLLNHLNLFGAGYLQPCRNTMAALVGC